MDRDDMKRRIINTANERLYRFGINEFRVDPLCADLKISKKTFYEMFDTKDSLIELCIRGVLEEHDRKVRSIRDSTTEPLERLFFILKFYLQFRYRVQPVYFSEVSSYKPYDLILNGLGEFWIETVKQVLEECGKHTVRRLDSREYSRFVLETINNFRYKRIPFYAAADMIFYVVRGCVKAEYLDEVTTIYKKHGCDN